MPSCAAVPLLTAVTVALTDRKRVLYTINHHY